MRDRKIMANENEKPVAQNKPIASVESSKPVDSSAAAKLARQEELTKQWGLDGKTTNLTRDSIIGTTRAKLIEQGKSEEEATKLAVKRGFEMIPE
jgi:hypothetical protein